MNSPRFYDYYRDLRYDNITAPKYRHIFMLLYWPVFGFLFWFAEKFYPVNSYNVVYTPVDSIIPFCELFVFPYVLWYFYLIGIHIYTFFFDVDTFKKLMKYIIFTYSVTLVIYFVFPTCQLLRPVVFERQNILTDFMRCFIHVSSFHHIKIFYKCQFKILLRSTHRWKQFKIVCLTALCCIFCKN